jgi:hypothetical protein
MRKTLMLSALLCLTACVQRPVTVQTPPAQCGKLIPETWLQPVQSVPIPTVPDYAGKPLTDAVLAAIVAPWAAAYVQTDAQLDKANGRIADVIWIIRQCEQAVNESRLGK